MQLASSLGPRFYLNIFKCKQISETGAQQVRTLFIYLFLFFEIVIHWYQNAKQDIYLNILPKETIRRKGYSNIYRLKLVYRLNYFDPYDLHTKFQLSQITLRGVPLKVIVVEAQKEE